MQEKDKEHNDKTKDEKDIEELERLDKEFEERIKKLREQDPFIYD